MKLKINIILTIFISILFISCSVNQEKGSIPIRLPESGADRAVGDYNYARILLLTRAGYINIDPTTEQVYQDVPYEDGAYTIENIKPSFVYDLVVIFGDKVNGVFTEILAYAVADDLTVTAGINNSISMTIVESKFTWTSQFIGKNTTQVINIADTIYTKSEAVTYEGIFIDGTEINSGLSEVQSIGHGKNTDGTDELWINTTAGIYPYRDGSADSEFSSGLTSTDLSITESAGLIMEDSDGGDDIFIAYFQGEGSVGGVQIDADKDPSEWEWFDKASLIEEMPDMEDLLDGLDTIIYDFVAKGSYAYMATALPVAAFRVSADTMGDVDNLPEDPTFEDLKGLVEFIVVKDSENKPVTIKSITTQGTNLYLGSEKGLYVAPIDTIDGSLITAGDVTTLITGTANKTILKLTSTEDGYVAVLTEGGVVVIQNTTVLEEFMFYQGLPGELTDITWKDSTLFISGSAGVVELDVTNL